MRATPSTTPLDEYPPKVDIVFITALEDELKPILSFASDWKKDSTEKFPYYYAQIKFGETPLSVVAYARGKVGAVPTANALQRFRKFSPKAVIMTGICAGWEEKDNLQLGDVIVALDAFDADAGKFTAERREHNIHTFGPPPWLTGHLQSVDHDLSWVHTIITPRPLSTRFQGESVLCMMNEEPTPYSHNPNVLTFIEERNLNGITIRNWLRAKKYLSDNETLTDHALNRIAELRLHNSGKLTPIKDRSVPMVHYGTFGSRQQIVAMDGEFLHYSEHVRELRAFEMEVAAFYETAVELDYEIWFAVKGVSDYGDSVKDDSFHAYAAEASARWAFAFISKKWQAIIADSKTYDSYPDNILSVDSTSSQNVDPVVLLSRIRDTFAAMESNSLASQAYNKALRDLETIWAQSAQTTMKEDLQSMAELPNLGDFFRYALILTSMNSMADNYSPPLIAAAIAHGIWDIETAISIVERLTDPRQCTDACIAILEARVPLEQNLRLHRIFFDAIEHCTDYSLLVPALRKISPLLHNDYVEKVIQIISTIVFLADQAEALATILPYIEDPRKQKLLQDCVNQISAKDDDLDQGHALAAIAPHLPSDLVKQAINITRDLRGHYERSSVITAITSRLTNEQVRDIFLVATSIQDGKERANSISALAEVLPIDLIDEALSNIENVDEIHARNTALVDLSLRINDQEKKNQILDKVFEDIRANNNTVTRSDFPTRWLYEKLPNEYQIQAIRLSFDTANSVSSGWHRAQAFSLALFRLCKRGNSAEFDEMFDRGFHELLHLAVATCDSLTQLIPHLPESYQKLAIETVRNALELPIMDEDERERQQSKKNRITWATRILPHIEGSEREATLQIILNLTFSLMHQHDIFDVITPLIPHLTGRELRHLLKALSPISDVSSRAAALARIAKHIPQSEQELIIERILTLYLPQMLTERDKALSITQIASMLEDKELRQCMNIIADFREDRVVAGALANLTISAPMPPIDEIFDVALKMTDEDGRATIIQALAEKLTSNQIKQCLDFVLSLSDARQKTKILHSFSSKLTRSQIQDCYSKIYSGSEKLINIVVAAALCPVMEPDTRRDFLQESVNTIIATQPSSSQFGIAWATSSISPFLDEEPKQEVVNYALHAVNTMPGNMSAYPGGNPKTNAFKILIPHLSIEMQKGALSEIQTIPHFGGFLGDNNNPVSEVLKATAADLGDDLLPIAIDLLRNIDDDWNKVNALETIAGRTTEAVWDHFISVVQQIEAGWMRARVLGALFERYPNQKDIVSLVHEALLVHLDQMKVSKRDELLWSVDVHLFKEPYMTEAALKQIVHHIIEVCDEWDWRLPAGGN